MNKRPHEHSISFPLDDVNIQRTDKVTEVKDPVYSNDWMSISPSEFSMTVKNVGSFYAFDGHRIEYCPDDHADIASLELYLNGSVYGAILHQRQILPLHGSSFIFNDSGVMFCGDSGAGKSSLTTSFCFNGGRFLTDDVTPILFHGKKACIWPKSGKIKLWDDSLQQFEKEKSALTKIRPEDEKYYLQIESIVKDPFPLTSIFILQVSDDREVTFEKVHKVDAFSYLHHEIYRREYLFAMPKTEADYLEKISSICRAASITRIKRPKTIPIAAMRAHIEDYLNSGS